MTASPRIVLAGSVSFSERALAALIRNNANVVGVLGLAESASQGVSDYAALEPLAAGAAIPYRDFVKINTPEIVEQVRQWKPDVLFVVGLSQLVHADLMALPTTGAVGFHPTRLPRGRGRAPVAWLTFDEADGAASFFVLEDEADAGAIFVQEPFEVRPGAYAQEVIQSVRDAIERALDRWLPSLRRGEWNPVPQDEAKASWWAKRGPEDGLIDWSWPAVEIARLVRTASRPYPGAYTYARGEKLLIWRASVADLPFRGVTGRIVQTRDGEVLVQTGDGLLRIEEHELPSGSTRRLAVGQKLGYAVEDELHELRRRVEALEKRLAGGARD
ncbi:MAG TPA: formyltransferase family protein [Thermoanaerobaculia bacterium]|nr:formyltransferase family protein [Thermoanaerobaculia bacterium]